MAIKKKFYITTPIYYASGNPHIGHAYATVMADTIARYKREMGYDVFFLTGMDEHGEKIQQKAILSGISPQKYVDDIAQIFKDLWKALGISNDDFIRTTDKRHVECVQKIFSTLYEKGDIYKGKYEGWYCTPCESFYTETQLDENHCCPECHREVTFKAEDCYYLNCNKYLPQLLKFYEKHPDFCPNGKLNEMIKTFIEPGLNDLCITRTSFDWGIPIKEDPKHVVYVWIDALVNYLSALGYMSDDDKKFKEFFSKGSEIFQIAGREINRFHTIYWPIMLMALGLRLPDTVYIHGLLLTKSGVKLSKSLGNAPSPYPIIERYGLDALRYYDARENAFHSDGNFTPQMFVDRINMDLVNNYANLVNRTINMVKKYFQGQLPKFLPGRINKLSQTSELIDTMNQQTKEYMKNFDDFNVNKAMQNAMNIVDKANKYIELTTPWTLSKEGKTDELSEVMFFLCEAIRVSSLLLRPSLINKSNEALDLINCPEEYRSFKTLSKHYCMSKVIVKDPIHLYPRLDVEKEVEFLVKLIDGE